MPNTSTSIDTATDRSSTSYDDRPLPVAVLGAGPVGLSAAAHLAERGLPFVVFEAGESVGSAIRQWGHVRLFTPWRHLVDPAMARLLAQVGWCQSEPDDVPTGGELVDRLLEPLALTPQLAGNVRTGRRVREVTRLGFDRMRTAGREEAPFVVVTAGRSGEERTLASAVIDATGTWAGKNPLGGDGVPAAGERLLAERLRYGMPDLGGEERELHRGVRTLVVGSGHSAMGTVLELAQLAEESVGTSVTWAVRRSDPGRLFGGGIDDDLPERGSLGSRARQLVGSGAVDLLTGFSVESVGDAGGRLRVVAADGRSVVSDRVVVVTGFRPDLSTTRELRLALDPVTEAPVKLAPLIDPNVHSCGTVPPHGEAELRHPESGFYVVGMKSYGRAPTFLLRTGYEQVRSVVAHLAGDHAAARRVELELPSSGVCSAPVTLVGQGAAGESGPRETVTCC